MLFGDYCFGLFACGMLLSAPAADGLRPFLLYICPSDINIGMNKFDTFYESVMNESRRTPEETERLQRNLERYRYLMSAQEQGEGDYFDWDEFEDYSDYEDEIEALEKEAEANGYLDQLERHADFDADRERRNAHRIDDPLDDKADQVKRHRFKKDGKLNKQDVETMKKGLKGRRAEYSVKGMEKPNLPEDAESPMDAVANITGELNGHGRMAAKAITTIFSLVEDEGQEMLDKQAAEKLEDIIELASNALRELNNRLN